MSEQNEKSLQFENKVQFLLERFLKGKLTGRSFAIRLIAILGIVFLISGFITSVVTANISNLMYADIQTISPWLSLSSILPTVLGVISVLSFLLTTSLVVRRVNDIIPDTETWPYALGAVLICFIPFVSYLLYAMLIFVPSDYLTQEKRNQITKKYA